MDREERFKEALKRYVSRLPFCANSLQRQISELEAVAAGLDKTHKLIDQIIGMSVVVAVVAGVLLAPATTGASLAVAALGVGVALTDRVTGASAAITKKVKTNQVRKKVKSILKEYQSVMCDIEAYSKAINLEMEKLKSVSVKSAKIVTLVEIAGGTSGDLSVLNRSSGVIQGFALGMDWLFTEVAGQIQAGLTELLDMRDKLQSEGI